MDTIAPRCGMHCSDIAYYGVNVREEKEKLTSISSANLTRLNLVICITSIFTSLSTSQSTTVPLLPAILKTV